MQQQDSVDSGSLSYDPATVDLSGRCVGNSYILICPIGQGATGTVWRGVERTSGDQVAVKLLHESLLRQPKLVTRFVQERTILQMLHHENIVRVRDLFSAGESLGLVMDLVAGGSLREHLRGLGTIAPGEAARLVGQVAGALAEAHGLGVVHRDVKPDNILLTLDGERPETRLTDFGIARVLDISGLTTPQAVVGTPRYMAPEAISGATPTPATDVYALGVVLYELVAGRPPYRGEPIAVLLGRHLDDEPRRPAGMPGAVWDEIVACLDKNPANRPSAAELTSRLADVARSVADLPALPVPPPDELDDGDGPPTGDSGTGCRAGVVRHPSMVAPGRIPPSRRNRPRSWLWRRPGAVAFLVGGALLASGLGGLGAWQLRDLAAARPPAPVTPTGAAAPTPGRAPTAALPTASGATTVTSGARKAGPSTGLGIGVGGRLPVPGAGREPVRAGVSAGPAAVGASAGPGGVGVGGRVFGPWQCGEEYAWDVGHPVLARPCHSVGSAIRVMGRMQASPGVQADVFLTVQDAGTDRVVAGPYHCKALMFTDFRPEHSCGPFDLNAPRGRRYVVVQRWEYTGRALLPGGTAEGPEFTW